MSSQRFPPKFKGEAVRQIVERGYKVTEVAERLGVSTNSLYKWVKAVKPDKKEQNAAEVIEAKSEVLKLRAHCSISMPNSEVGQQLLAGPIDTRDPAQRGRAVPRILPTMQMPALRL